MGDQDWLERGHGSGAGLQPMIKGSSGRVGDRVSIRSVLRGADAPRRTRRRTKALVGWLLYCCTAVGGTAGAWTVRETLFPSLGAPTTRSVWENPRVDTPVTTEHGSRSTESTEGLETAAIETVVDTTQPSITDQTAPSDSSSGEVPGIPVADNGSGSGKTPATGTTIAADPSSDPGPGTTIADDPSDTSSSISPTNGDSTTTTNAGPDTSDSSSGSGENSGKGGDGGNPGTP